MPLMTGRDTLFRARLEMVVILLAKKDRSKLNELASEMEIHPSYLCRFLRDLADVGLVLRPAWGRYSLQVPVGEFEWRWLEIPFLDSQPNVVACQRLCGELEFRWYTDVGLGGPSWPWGDYITRASRNWPRDVSKRVSLWRSLKNSVGKVYRKVAYRARKS